MAVNGAAWGPGLARHVAFMGQEDHFLAEVRARVRAWVGVGCVVVVGGQWLLF